MSYISPFRGYWTATLGSLAFVIILIGWATFLQPVVDGKNGFADIQYAVSMEGGGPLIAGLDGTLVSYARPLAFIPEVGIESVSMSGAVLGSSDPLNDLLSVDNGLRKYRIREGDTLTGIAAKFGITIDTIRWANPETRSTLRPGRELIILPVSGVIYEVKDGDDLEEIANIFHADIGKIKEYNPEYQEIIATSQGIIIIPDARPTGSLGMEATTAGLPDLGDFFIIPAVGWNWGKLHRYNAIDIANDCGTPVYAAAEGLVISDEVLGDGSSGWNNGYGNFLLIEHLNGTRTRYAHLQEASVRAGDYVRQGDEIGLIGNTGNTHGPTGCHLHFEIYGAKNPFAIR